MKQIIYHAQYINKEWMMQTYDKTYTVCIPFWKNLEAYLANKLFEKCVKHIEKDYNKNYISSSISLKNNKGLEHVSEKNKLEHYIKRDEEFNDIDFEFKVELKEA